MSRMYAIQEIEKMLKPLFNLDSKDRRLGFYLDALRNLYVAKQPLSIDNTSTIFDETLYEAGHRAERFNDFIKFKLCLCHKFKDAVTPITGAPTHLMPLKPTLAQALRDRISDFNSDDTKFILKMLEENSYEFYDQNKNKISNTEVYHKRDLITYIANDKAYAAAEKAEAANDADANTINTANTELDKAFNTIKSDLLRGKPGAAALDAANYKDCGVAVTFNYFLDKMYLKDTIDSFSRAIIDNIKDDPFDIDQPVTNNDYYRKDDGRLYTRDNNKKEMVLDGKEAIGEELSKKCYGTMNNNGATNTCVKLISDCIRNPTNDSVLQCKAHMMDKDFWTDIASEIKQINPIIAYETLTNVFKFKTINSEQSNLLVVESVGTWLARQQKLSTMADAVSKTKNGIDQGEYQQIKDNTKLNAYLTGLVNKINSSPAILNPNYAGTSQYLTDAGLKSRFNGWVLSKYAVPGRIYRTNENIKSIYSQLGLVDTNLGSVRRIYENRLNYISGTGFLVGGLAHKLNANTYPYQLGGEGDDTDDENNQTGGRLLVREDIPLTFKQMEQLVAGIKQTASARNKRLAQVTEGKLNDLLAKYKHSELNLWRAIIASERYFDYLNIYKENDPNGILTVDHMIKFIEARSLQYGKLLGRKDNLVSLIKAVVDEMSDKEEM